MPLYGASYTEYYIGELLDPTCIKKELALDVSLYTFLQILSVHSFEKIQLSCAFQGRDNANCDDPFDNQMNLFDS